MQDESNSTAGEDAGTGKRRDPLDDLGRRIDAAIQDAGPRIKSAIDEMEQKVDAALSEIRPRVDAAFDEVRPRVEAAIRDVQPKVDRFVRDVQPRMDSFFARLQKSIDDMRREMETRARRAASPPDHQITPTSVGAPSTGSGPDGRPGEGSGGAR